MKQSLSMILHKDSKDGEIGMHIQYSLTTVSDFLFVSCIWNEYSHNFRDFRGIAVY
jgi:hypothetical protein